MSAGISWFGCGEQQSDEFARVAADPQLAIRVPSLHLYLPGIVELAQPPLTEQRLVDGAEPALERGEYRRAEGDGLAVHGTAGRDDEVGVGHEALGVDGPGGHDEVPEPGELLALRGGAR